MIKKIVALFVVLLLPVSFISSASAASKSVTCYKGTTSKVVKNSTGKCPAGWSSKKPSSAINGNKTTEKYKIQEISPSEVAILITTYATALSLYNEARSNYQSKVDSCLSSILPDYKYINMIQNLKGQIKRREERLAQAQSDVDTLTSVYSQPFDTDAARKEIFGLLELAKIEVNNVKNEINTLKNSLSENEASLKNNKVAKEKCIPKDHSQVQGKTIRDYYVNDKLSSEVAKKIAQNFCGLNGQILKRDLETINASDLMIGYDKFNNTVMKLIFSDLEIMAKNRELTINTPDTDKFVTMFYPNAQITYGSEILNQKLWSEAIGKTEYGISVSTDKLQTLIKNLKVTVDFCNNI